jgi:XTP/dITP diphosphohydrolase
MPWAVHRACTARYAGHPTNAANNAKLLDAMADVPDGQRSAASMR